MVIHMYVLIEIDMVVVYCFSLSLLILAVSYSMVLMIWNSYLSLFILI